MWAAGSSSDGVHLWHQIQYRRRSRQTLKQWMPDELYMDFVPLVVCVLTSYIPAPREDFLYVLRICVFVLVYLVLANLFSAFAVLSLKVQLQGCLVDVENDLRGL